ncbi:allantoate amidohydrolase [Phytoactinopolyspora mesophila]|uniref:Allantoate amidohydrolase n=1 Tax=Phytoactinopolyspora mesophila TaxID=2650750 RepID=A0A7K3M4X4_9ACTN|nr:allantoate amidohydrolase [Phytoactinopolyspora mesophila]NDL57478.1 allantoate amidohydrolase [Phytoactinopolyspora mesophila]
MSGLHGVDRTGREFDRMWGELAPVGRGRDGGYRRFAWTREDATLREWFTAEATRRGLTLVTDRAGNQWAWWGDPDTDGPGVVTGSHVDSVPSGGAYDGPLGVVSALLAVDVLRANGWTPSRPIGIASFADEEGARFGVACAGSRLLTGALPPGRALSLTDENGITMAEAMRAAGHEPDHVDGDAEALSRVATFVELHVEQGRGLVDLGEPVGVASMIWPHGRWRVTLAGQANHAGTTPLPDRLDPMLTLATLITAVRASALRHGALATVGKVSVEPNGVNAIPSQVTAWLDCRAADEEAVRHVLDDLSTFGPVQESWTPATVFDTDLATRLSDAASEGEPVPVLGTGAGHDAGVLSTAGIPTAMLFVRNPTGVSHSPEEFAERADCLDGVHALTRCLAELTR